MRYQLSEIPSGVAGTDATLREIARQIQNDLKRPFIRLLATRLLQSYLVASKDSYAEAEAIFQAVHRHIRYQKDPIGIETVQSPEATWNIRAGDCDDHVGLVAALATSVGIPARFRVLGYSDNELIHIYPELFVNGRWYPADTTEPARGFGWRPPPFPVERVYNLQGEVKNMNLGETPVARRQELKSSVYQNVAATIKANWENGLINRNDVEGYLRVIHEGNFPTKSPVLVEPTEQAITDFLDYVDTNRIGSVKPAGDQFGMDGLDGFLSSVWGAVKKGVGAVAGVLGVGKQPAPVVNVAAPAAAPAQGGFFGGNMTTPLLIGGGVLLAVLLVRK